MSEIQANSQELEAIYNKIQEIDKQVKQLEKASQKVIVTGSKSNPQPKALNLTEEQFINIYNYTPQIFADYAVMVSVSGEEKNHKKVILDSTNNGYYWIILVENQLSKNYWLVPNSNRKIRFHRWQNHIESLFKIDGDIINDQGNLVLIKPSLVNILPSGESWELTLKGEIYIDNISPSDKVLEKLEILKNNETETLEHFQDFTDFLKDYYHHSLNLQEEQELLKQNFMEITDKLLKIKYLSGEDIYKDIDTFKLNLETQISELIQENELIYSENFLKIFNNFKIQDDKLNQTIEYFMIKRREQLAMIKSMKGNLGCLNIAVVLLLFLIIGILIY
ncbi:hypothetical protein ACN4EE_21910 [Geminocystis sp. CENA526]|uniref:hypothetical protein n=1 Tax=Geminocystis sp. CENA526 TaxID=1355871 RepID=UPI003D6E56E8